MTSSCKRLLLTGLLALALLGMQLSKDAPWHEHERHLADCALCQLQFNEAAVLTVAALPLSSFTDRFFHGLTRPASATFRFPAFQSRAPPANL